MIARTTHCSDHDHLEFCLQVGDEVLPTDVAWFLSLLERTVEAGIRYLPGMIVQIASMQFQIDDGDGTLDLLEPDFQSVPIAWQPGITRSMHLLRLQRDVAESFETEMELDYPSLRSTVWCHGEPEEFEDQFVLERGLGEDDASGWVCGKEMGDLDGLSLEDSEKMPLYAFMVHCPQVIGFLALPVGTRVEASLESVDVSLYGEPLTLKEGSYLDQVNQLR